MAKKVEKTPPAVPKPAGHDPGDAYYFWPAAKPKPAKWRPARALFPCAACGRVRTVCARAAVRVLWAQGAIVALGCRACDYRWRVTRDVP